MPDETLVEQFGGGRDDPDFEPVGFEVGQQLLHFGVELPLEFFVEALPADVAELVGCEARKEVDAEPGMQHAHVVAVDEAVADRPLPTRSFVLAAFVPGFGVVVHGFVGEVVGYLSEQRPVAVEDGDLALLDRERRVEERFDLAVGFFGKTVDGAVGLRCGGHRAQQPRCGEEQGEPQGGKVSFHGSFVCRIGR